MHVSLVYRGVLGTKQSKRYLSVKLAKNGNGRRERGGAFIAQHPFTHYLMTIKNKEGEGEGETKNKAPLFATASASL